jgi:hypothetical protein
MRDHPVEPAAAPAFGFEQVMRRPDHGRFMDWYRRSSFFAPRPSVADSFSQPYAVEAGLEALDQAA